MNQQTKELPWILFNLQNEIYGISCQSVDSIVILSQVTAVADTPNYIRGVINLRGKIVTCIDLRILLGLKSLNDEIIEFQEMLEQRKIEHINWLEELKNSVDQRRPFELTTDPHACAFGKWYDNFKTDNVILGGLVKRFDEPHKKIHGIAIEIKKLEAREEFAGAKRTIEQVESGELKSLIDLFAKTKAAYRESLREIVIIVKIAQTLYGFITDNVISVEHIIDDGTANINNHFLKKELSFRIAMRKKEKSSVILLNEDNLLNL